MPPIAGSDFEHTAGHTVTPVADADTRQGSKRGPHLQLTPPHKDTAGFELAYAHTAAFELVYAHTAGFRKSCAHSRVRNRTHHTARDVIVRNTAGFEIVPTLCRPCNRTHTAGFEPAATCPDRTHPPLTTSHACRRV